MTSRVVVVAAVLALATPARAELWTSTLGDLLHAATKIAIVHVDKLSGSVIDGTVAEAVVGAKFGDVVHVDLARLAAPAVGDRVLVVCDQFLCPRAAAIDHGGWFELAAQEPGDGAFVTPSIVERGSLLPLSLARPAAELCIRGVIELIDDRILPTFDIAVGAADGTGGGTLENARVLGSLSVPWYGDERGLEVRIESNHHTIELVADHVSRAHDGCYNGKFAPTRPFVRTHRALSRALSGKHASTVLAQATFEVAPGAPVASGHHVLELSIDDDGDLVLASDLVTARVDEANTGSGHLVIGFPTTTADFYPQLELDLGPTPANVPTNAVGAALALMKLKTAAVAWVTHPSATLVTTPLGTASVMYVRDR